MISVSLLYGRADDDDKDRAREAASDFLAARGISPAEACAEYRRQWEAYDDEAKMHGMAAVWIEARQAADLALTDGWANPDGAACTIDA